MSARRPGSTRKPRNSRKPNPPMTTEQRAVWDRLSPPSTRADVIRDGMARAMCPDAWAEYDAGNGVCSNMAGHACVESISHASRAYRYLFEQGFGLPRPPAPKSGQ